MILHPWHLHNTGERDRSINHNLEAIMTYQERINGIRRSLINTIKAIEDELGYDDLSSRAESQLRDWPIEKLEDYLDWLQMDGPDGYEDMCA